MWLVEVGAIKLGVNMQHVRWHTNNMYLWRRHVLLVGWSLDIYECQYCSFMTNNVNWTRGFSKSWPISNERCMSMCVMVSSLNMYKPLYATFYNPYRKSHLAILNRHSYILFIELKWWGLYAICRCLWFFFPSFCSMILNLKLKYLGPTL